MKSLISIVLLFLNINCNQKETDLKFIENYINVNNSDLSHKYILFKSRDTKSTLDIYKTAYNYYLKEGISNEDWIEKYKWPFTKEELNALEVENEGSVWKQGEVHPKLEIYNNFEGKTKEEIVSFVRSNSQVITVSRPLFNVQKNKAMFYYSKSIGVGSVVDTCVVILVKENNKWIVVGKAYSTEVY